MQVDPVEGTTIASVACGFAHTVLIANTEACSATAKVVGALPSLNKYEINRRRAVYRGPTAYILFAKDAREVLKAERLAKYDSGVVFIVVVMAYCNPTLLVLAVHPSASAEWRAKTTLIRPQLLPGKLHIDGAP